MKFEQQKDGGATLIFSEKEIEIIKEKKQLLFTPEGLRHFGNNLVRIVAEWNLNFNKDIQDVVTHGDELDK
jgi:hypothetical protein